MGFALVTPAQAEPVPLAEMKPHLGERASHRDVEIEGLIAAAREWAEGYINQRLMSQTWDYFLAAFPKCIELPFGPVTSVSSVSYVDPSGDSQTIDAADLDVDLKGVVPKIRPAYGTTWPSTYSQQNAVTVRFVAGYASAELVPSRIKTAIKFHVDAHYDRDPANMKLLLDRAHDLLTPLRDLTF